MPIDQLLLETHVLRYIAIGVAVAAAAGAAGYYFYRRKSAKAHSNRAPSKRRYTIEYFGLPLGERSS